MLGDSTIKTAALALGFTEYLTRLIVVVSDSNLSISWLKLIFLLSHEMDKLNSFAPKMTWFLERKKKAKPRIAKVIAEVIKR